MLRITLISVLLAYVAFTQAAGVPWSQVPGFLPDDEADVVHGPELEESFVQGLLQDPSSSSTLEMNDKLIERLLKSLEAHWEETQGKDKPLSIFPASLESEEHAEVDMPASPFFQTLPMATYHFDLHANNDGGVKSLVEDDNQQPQLPSVEIEFAAEEEPEIAAIPEPNVEAEMTEARKAELLEALDDLLPSRDENRIGDFAAYLTYIFLILVVILGFYVFYVKNYSEPLITQLVVDQVKSYDGKTVVLLVPVSDKCSCPPEYSVQLDHVYLDVTKLEKK